MSRLSSKATFHQKLILLTAVPLLGLIGIGGVFLFRISQEFQGVAHDRRVMEAYAHSQDVIIRLSRAIQEERLGALYLAAKVGPADVRTAAFKRQIAATELMGQEAQTWFEQLESAPDGSAFRANIQAFQSVLSTLPDTRKGVLSGGISVATVMVNYSKIPLGALPIAEIHRKFLGSAETLNSFDGIFTVNKMREQDAMIAGMFAVTGEGYRLSDDDFMVIRKQYFALSEGDGFLRSCFPDLRQFYAGNLRSDPASMAYLKYLGDLSTTFKEGTMLAPFPYAALSLNALMAKRAEASVEAIDYGFRLAFTHMQVAADAHRTLALNLAFAISAAIGLSLIVNLAVTRNLKLRIVEVADEINHAAGDVHAATSKSTTASSEIASNATIYAAALAQIGSAFREINQTARLNNEHTHKGDTLASGANASVNSGRGAVRELGTAMDAIGGSSQKISKIVLRINELSFQTNILALNAAIEAARAGEAGAGFSVVAEEVRRLAHQCAAAADETNALIEESSRHAALAMEKSNHVSQVFDEISASVREVAVIISKISKNHREQTEQIGQANQAVVDQLVVSQTTASVAEETGRAAALLQSQVAALTRSVQVLNMMVGRRAKVPRVSESNGFSPDVARHPSVNRLTTPHSAALN